MYFFFGLCFTENVAGRSIVEDWGKNVATMEHNEKGIEAKHDDEDEEEERQEVQEIWSWGAGTEGQLGTGRLEDEHLPQLLHLPSLASSAAPISLLTCGGAHVVALTSGATLFFLFSLFFLRFLFF
jgi:alpha-tubulin suppressor-like RCC1 family protein